MSNPERSTSDFYRHGRGGAAEGEIRDEHSSSRRDPVRHLRRSIAAEPEIDDEEEESPRRPRTVGWFAAGFVIALAVGAAGAWFAVGGLPSIGNKTAGSNGKTPEFSSRFDNSKTPDEANSASAAAPRPVQSGSPVTSAPGAAASPQPANGAPARVANLGGPSEPAPTVRGVTDNEIRFGISAPFSGAAKELGQNM